MRKSILRPKVNISFFLPEISKDDNEWSKCRKI